MSRNTLYKHKEIKLPPISRSLGDIFISSNYLEGKVRQYEQYKN